MATTLKQGSKGKLVEDLQKYLNLKAKLPKPVPESSEFCAVTKEGVKIFQKKSGLPPDGIVGSATAGALARLVGPSASSFARTFGPLEATEEEKEQPQEDLVTVTIHGKASTMTKAQFAENQKQAREVIRGTLRAAQQQAVMARTLWDHFHELQTDQGVVAWCVSMTGPDLPDVGTIVDAEAAVKRLETALNGPDFDKMAAALENLCDPVKKAAKAMFDYQSEVTDSAENWVFGLEVTRDVSFEIAKAIAKFETGGNPAAAKGIDVLAETIKSAYGEVGKAIAGTSGGGVNSLKTIAKDTMIAGIMSLLLGEGSKGKELFANVEKSLLSRLAKSECQWLAGRPALQKFVAAWVSKYLAANASNIAKETMKFATTDMTVAQLGENIAKSLATSFPLSGLDSWVDQKFAKSLYESLKKSPHLLKILQEAKAKTLDEKVAMEVLKKELLTGSASKAVEKSLDAALSRLTGNVTAEQVGNAAVDEMARSSEFRALCDKIAKQMK